MKPRVAVTLFEVEVAPLTDPDTARRLGELAWARRQMLKVSGAEREALTETTAELGALEARWYGALRNGGGPDYGVYAEPLYLAELLACWLLYSRQYLREVTRMGLIPGNPETVADLGCGLGWSTWALSEIFPDATVSATEWPGSLQRRIAEAVSSHRFRLVDDTAAVAQADLIFASEYFEHFQRPVDELRAVLELGPRELIIANTFGPDSIGHFDRYEVDGTELDPRSASRSFDEELRSHGFSKRETPLWNSRPTIWSLDG